MEIKQLMERLHEGHIKMQEMAEVVSLLNKSTQEINKLADHLQKKP
jgi:hypothetical protein